MADGPPDTGLRSGVRRAVGGALDATVGRVGHTVSEAAMDVTGATAQQVIEDLEPYLISEAIPRIVDGLTPYLTDKVVPEVLEGITDHLVADTVPDIVDGVTAHLVAVTVPQVVDGVTPRLVADLLPKLLEDLRPYLEAELVPRIVEGLVPYIQEQVAPELIDGLMPKIRDEVAPQLIEALMPRIEEQIAPQLIDALMPKIRDQIAPDLVEALMPRIRDEMAPQLVDALMPKITDEVAPQLVDALMPKITNEVAPQLVDSLMPKIRTEVVPLILDDIVDDPAVRDLIREQSQGLFLDAIEGFRGTLADADNLTERVVRRILRRPPRPQAESGLQLVLAEESEEDVKPLRLAVEDLATQRALWRAMPVPPAPPGRSYMYAGTATRLLGLVLDLAGVGYITSQVLNTVVSLLQSLFGTLPQWLTVVLYVIAACAIPVYLSLCYWAAGRTFGMAVVGIRVCTPDGRRPALLRSIARAWMGMFGLIIWLLTGVFSLFDARRRTLLDRLVHTEVRYSVPETQQRRHVRDAIQEKRDAARKAARAAHEDRAAEQARLELAARPPAAADPTDPEVPPAEA